MDDRRVSDQLLCPADENTRAGVGEEDSQIDRYYSVQWLKRYTNVNDHVAGTGV